jgi:hypothetical protein
MMKTRSSVFGLAGLSLIFILSPGLELGFQENITLQKKTEEADLIVVGRVTKVEARWNDPTLKTMIYTYTTISVEEEIKESSPEKEITIRVPGGVVDGIMGIIDGMAHFHTGERVVVFLLRDLQSSRFFVLGGIIGKYTIGIDNKVEFIGKSLSVFLDEIRQYISN